MAHIPVLANEVVKFIEPKGGRNYIDCTLGDGGHAELILAHSSPDGKLLGIDRDQGSLRRAEKNLQRFNGRTILIHESYSNLSTIIAHYNFSNIYGILFDLGISSYHIEESGGGFSFRANEPLDMWFNRLGQAETAADILNTRDKAQLEEILEMFGGETYALNIAEEIIRKRERHKIETTADLLEIINKVKKRTNRKTHPATKTFQALRIAVNKEMDLLAEVLPQMTENLKKGGRIAFISYHSLEDAIVKDFFQGLAQANEVKILTDKPVSPSLIEQRENPRSRSAKLRVVEKI